MKARSGAVLVVALIALGVAGAEGRSRAHAGEEPESSYARWIQGLEKAQTDLAQARRNLRVAAASLRDQKQRRYPRGQAKQELERELEKARLELEELERALPELLERARRAGVPQSMLRPYEELLAEKR